MKEKLLLVFRIAAFILVVWFVLSWIYNVLKWKDTNGDYVSSVEQLYSTEKNTIDVVFTGSSHCFCGIRPSVLWENYGISSFCMSTSGQHKAATTHMLKELLKTQSPSVVVVDMHALQYDYHAVLGNIYRNLLSLRTSPNSLGLVREYMANRDEEKLDIVPVDMLEMMAKWPVIHTRYKELTKDDFVYFEPNRYVRGEITNTGQYSVEWGMDFKMIQECTPLSESNKKWLDDLMELSEREGFKLVFQVIPFAHDEIAQGINNGASEYIRSRGYEVYDFNLCLEETGIDCATDFGDSTHLNYHGAEKLTTYIAENVLNIYELTDHRGESRYEAWEKDMLFCRHQEQNDSLLSCESFEAAAEVLKEMNGYRIIVSLDGEINGAVCEEYGLGFEWFGIDRDTLGNGGIWLIDNGDIEYINLNDSSKQPYMLDLGAKDTLRIEYLGKLVPQNILIGARALRSPSHYVSMIVYDNLLEQIVFYGEY